MPTSWFAQRTLWWIALLYVAQGLPFGVFYEVVPVYLRIQGVDVRQIGAVSLIGLAWTFKFLWAPLVDRLGRPQTWVCSMLLAFSLATLIFPILPTHEGALLAPLLVIALLALFSATNDIAIDGYSIRMLEGKNLGSANGVRVAAYRIGLLITGGALALQGLIGWVGLFTIIALTTAALAVGVLFSPRLAPHQLLAESQRGWRVLWRDGTTFMREQPHTALAFVGLILLFSLWVVDGVPKHQPWINFSASLSQFSSLPQKFIWPLLWGLLMVGALLYRAYKKWTVNHLQSDINPSKKNHPPTTAAPPLNRQDGGLLALANRPYMKQVFLFILLFKLADASMGFMIKPFWVDSGFTPAQIGLVSVNIGIGLSIVGALIGGWYTDRVGLFRSLWVMGLWQIASNGVYALVAWQLPHFPIHFAAHSESMRLAAVYGASALESFTGGLGTASFLALLMVLVNAKFAASEYAALSALFATSRSIAGFLSGFGVHHWGYAPYFALTMLLGLPAYLLLPWVKLAINQALAQQKKSAD